MNDQTIPADQVREIIARHRDGASHRGGMILNDLKALLPTPPRPTMADMTEEERAACRWMQCDAGPYGRRGLIVKVKYWSVYVVDKETGTYSDYTPDLVTALPDLPRMEWNGTEKAEDVPPVKVGDAIESAADPRLDALPTGSILLDLYGEKVEKISDEAPRWTGPGCFPYAEEGTAYGPWKVVYIGEEAGQ